MPKVKSQTVPVETENRTKGRPAHASGLSLPLQSPGREDGAANTLTRLATPPSRVKRLTQQQLETHLWGAANILRGKTAGQDYKNYILSLMFYKRLSDQWECEADDAIAEQERQQGRSFTEQQKAVFRKRGEHRFNIPDS